MLPSHFPSDFPIQAVLFDYGMVLSLPRNPAVWSELATISGMPEAVLEDRYWQFRDAYDEGALTGDQFWSNVGATVGKTYTVAQLSALNDGDVRLWGGINVDMVQWVHALHAAGVRTGILSNMGDRMADGLMQMYDWIGHFHHRVWSHSLRMRKPQQAIYAVAAKGLKVEPSRILFIDDKAENTQAAEAFGMQAIVYSDYATFVGEMTARGYGLLLQPGQSFAL
jgi:putative hydrolase of the HAD superfamily